MNVLFVVPWDNLGGVSHVVNRVAEHVRAQGHGVVFLLPGDAAKPTAGKTLFGFPAYRLRTRPPRVHGRPLRSRLAFLLTFVLTLARIARLIRRERIDVVNIHYPGGTGIYFSILRRLGMVRLVTSVHGADLLPHGRRLGRLRATCALLEASDVVVMPSDSYRTALIAAWPEIRGHTRAIPNGVDPDELRAPDGAPAPTGAPFVLSIVQLVTYKGVDVLIRAFARLADAYPDLRLRLVSDGPQRPEYERLAATLGIAERVDFLGFIERPEVCRELRACTLFVLPSRSNSESFGIAAAEAMAVDRPVVASHIGGLPELIEDGVSGLLVPPGDDAELEAAMRRLLDDPDLRESLGRAAGERIRREFRWERTGVLYERMFSNLASHGRQPVPQASLGDPRGEPSRGRRVRLDPNVAMLPAAAIRHPIKTPTKI